MAEIVLTLFKMLADDDAFAGLPIYIYSSISVLNEYTNLREQISWKGANYNGLPYRLWMAQWAGGRHRESLPAGRSCVKSI